MSSLRNHLFALTVVLSALPALAHPGHAGSASGNVSSYLGQLPSVGEVVLTTASKDFWRKTFISKYNLGNLGDRVSIAWE